ncbi:hypothetical protein OTSANNIE_1623 [Anaplasma phagocytophilum str. Annie]|nr:hypothetical protein OTSANNIE_1623 [Anaplasma phagocytophilum str. Annie]
MRELSVVSLCECVGILAPCNLFPCGSGFLGDALPYVE